MYKIFVVLAVFSVTLVTPSKSFAVGEYPNVGIVGGHDADINEYPWQVSVQHEQSHFCGGSIIAPNWVLTAGHCLTQGFNTNISIRAGTSRTSYGGQTALVNYYVIHSSFSDNTLDNDIALLKLATPITYTNATRAATLPEAYATIPVGATLSVTGWGAIIEGGRSVENLQEVTVPTVDRAYCKRANIITNRVTKNMFCAGYAEGGKDACYGDSGSPATINGVVVGIVSWNNGCARRNAPGVYTQISNYREWITENSGI